jgi:hypothetical protein
MAQTSANTTNSSSSSEGAKVLIDDTMQALKNNDSNKAVVYINILNQQIAVWPDSIFKQLIKILLSDATEAIKNGDTNKAVVHLNLILADVQTVGSDLIKTFLEDATNSLQSNDSQGALVHLNWLNENREARGLGPLSSNETAKVLLNDAIKSIQSGDFKGALVHLNSLSYIPRQATAQSGSSTFQTYTNTDLGFTINYPSDWIVDDKNMSTRGVTIVSPEGLGGGAVIISSEDLKPNETKMSLDNLSKLMMQHQGHGTRFLELNENNYFLSGHPAIRAIIIQSYGAPGEPGATQGIEPHDAKMMMFLTISQAKKYSAF